MASSVFILATIVLLNFTVKMDTQTITVVGPISANIDDATSSTACPSGYVLSACRPDVGKSKCDGTTITTTGQCIAWSNGVKAVKAIATCVPETDLYYIFTVYTPNYQRKPIARCPMDTELLSCSPYSAWPQAVEFKEDFDNRVCYVDNNSAGCSSGHGCRIYIRCKRPKGTLYHTLFTQTIQGKKTSKDIVEQILVESKLVCFASCAKKNNCHGVNISRHRNADHKYVCEMTSWWPTEMSTMTDDSHFSFWQYP